MKNILINRKIILSILVFFSFIVRFILASTDVVYPDSCLYLSYAKSILTGKFSFNFRGDVETVLPPLYSLSDAVFAFLTGNFETAGVLVSAIAGALLIVPVFYLAKAIYNETAAWISSVLVFLSPVLIHWSGAMLTESLFITLFISGIALGWHALESRSKLFILLSGIFVGLSYMTRVIGLVALPVISLWVLIFFIKSSERGNFNPKMVFKGILTYLTVFSLGFILATGLYLIHLHSFYGYWTLAGGYGSIKGTISYEGAATTSGYEGQQNANAEESFAGRVIRKVSLNSSNYANSLLTMLTFTTAFVIIGLFSARWKILYIASFAFIYFSALLLQPLSPMLDERMRYLSPVVPLFLVLTSGGISRIKDWVKWKGINQIVIPISVLIVLLSSFAQFKMFPVHFDNIWNSGNRVNIRAKVAEWMKETIPKPIRIMSRKPNIPYYADAQWFVTPPTYPEVLELAKLKNVDYIVLDKGVDYYLRPELRFLFDPNKIPPELKFMGGVKHPETGELFIGLFKIER